MCVSVVISNGATMEITIQNMQYAANEANMYVCEWSFNVNNTREAKERRTKIPIAFYIDDDHNDWLTD